jgi:RNA-directed DNA polymerase
MVSALDNGVTGGRWYSLMDKVYAPALLAVAWARVRANRGAAGVDGQSIERFQARSEVCLAELGQALRDGAYRPQPVKRVDIPKGDGRTRPLGIPVVKDRIVQTAVKLVLEPIFEATFRAMSYGFRPGRGCHDALREVDGLLKEGFTHVVDADLAGYFDSIPHERLMGRVEERISDGRILALLRGWFGYFKHADPRTFKALDGFVRRRLRALLRKQTKGFGFGRCHADHQRWNNAFFARAGLATLLPAWHAARHRR